MYLMSGFATVDVHISANPLIKRTSKNLADLWT
jgi:hypothetical protein